MKNKSSSPGCLGYLLLIPLLPIIAPIAIIAGIFSSGTKSNNKNKQRYSEKELNDYGLWEDEKELVRKGENDPWDFEENEMLDDDDYYKDDSV